jgi:hypothetical protein
MPSAERFAFVQTRSASLGESLLILLLWLAAGVWFYNQQENLVASRKLRDAVSTDVVFLTAACHRNTYRSGPRAFLTKIYVYVPKPSGDPKTSYEVEDPIPYRSLDECEAELALAGSKFRRLHVWYDRNFPWKARWSLDEPSSNPILWFFGAGAVVILWPALAANRRRRAAQADG